MIVKKKSAFRIFSITQCIFFLFLFRNIYSIYISFINKSIRKWEYHDAAWKMDYPHPDTEYFP